MKQTDLQGETERALRAVAAMLETDALEPCQIGAQREIWSIAKAEAILIRELLPLFNAGIVGAYAAAAKQVDALAESLFTAMATLNEPCSGTNCAGCKLSMAVGKVKETAATILALTPADARQASQQVNHAHYLSGYEAGAVSVNQTAAIASAEARAYKRCADLVDFGDGDKPSLVMLKWAEGAAGAAVCPPEAKEHVMRLHYLLYVNERGKHIGHCLDFDIVTSADSRDEALKRLNILVGVHMERAVAKTPAPPEFWDRFHKVRQVCIADEAAACTPDSTKEQS